MKIFKICTAAVGVLVAPLSPAWGGQWWTGKYISQIQFDERACAFFLLDGVPNSDPVVTGDWFALPKSATNYQEMVSILLSAKLSRQTVDVGTDGTTSCGWATVKQINLR
ncbi:hypothetical protein M2336_001042 [Sphingobium sp. B1D7B]|uniref:hypothetical protein n=1 Tax=Sphingobium sp. B1D7B TaxID=2940578 RepID=UPI00222463CE|nr:hypothetical protein [Sphingobium sp. B1D7B]MCW2404413.1 hypothetical protein [Sphingobium sp. B1D7B]